MTDTIRTHTDQAGFLTLAPEPWTRDAACATTNPELFFPEPGGSSTAAKRICRTCPVINECLDYATRTRQNVGVRGGKAPRQLRAVREKQQS